MTTWQSLPKCLQRTDKEIANISWAEVDMLFNYATELGIVDKFSELFWIAMNRVRCNPNNASIQQCVNFLEERKRTIGRAYSIAKRKYPNGWLTRYQAIRYNECEYNIRWLVEQYKCTRKTKEYLLEV